MTFCIYVCMDYVCLELNDDKSCTIQQSTRRIQIAHKHDGAGLLTLTFRQSSCGGSPDKLMVFKNSVGYSVA